jgi:hypothetical protein
MTYLKQGHLEISNQDEDIFLRNSDGKLFNVTPIVAFVWEQLNGEHSLDQIETNIKDKVGNLYHEKDTNITEKIINELQKVDLVKTLS